MRVPVSTMLCLLLLLTVTANGDDSTWPQHRGNPGSTGVSPDGSIEPPLRLVWSYRCDSDTSGDAGAGLTVGGGMVFGNMDLTDSILALDAETGMFRWQFTHKFVHYKQASSYSDGKLFVWLRGNNRSFLAALDAKTGAVLWEKETGSTKGVLARRTGPAIADGKVLIADGDGVSAPAILCFDANSGKELWRKTLDAKHGTQVVTPCVVGGKIFTGTMTAFRSGVREIRGSAIALDLADGKELWRNAEIVVSAPPVSDGKIVVVKLNGQPGMPKGIQKLHVLDATTGKELWSLPIWIVYGTTTITADKLILKHYGGLMIAYDRFTGKKLWESQFGSGSGCSSPSVSGNYAFVGTGSFNDSEGIWAWRFIKPPHMYRDKEGAVWSFHAIDLSTGKSVWHCVTGNNVCGDIALAYGKAYVNSRDGRIYCFAPVGPGKALQANSTDPSPHAPADAVGKLLNEAGRVPRPGKDWPTEGGTPRRAGMSGGALAPPLAQAWTLPTGGRIISSPVVRNGKVYVGSLSGSITCADLKSGERTWQFKTAGEIKAAPAAAIDMVYCGSDDGKMYALDALTGAKRWEFVCGAAVQCSPAIAGGVLFFGANDYHFYALDRQTGKKLWSFKTEHPLVVTAPVVEGDTVYMAQWVDWVYALDAATGKEKWRDCVPISIEKLHFHRGKLYLRTPRQIAEYDPATGKRLRLADAAYGYNGLTFYRDLAVIAGTGSANILDLAAKGAPSRYNDQPALKDVLVLSSKRLANWPRLASMGTPLVVGDWLCIATLQGEVILVRPDLAAITSVVPWKNIWSAKLGDTCHSSPIVAEGYLLVGCDDGKLYAFTSK